MTEDINVVETNSLSSPTDITYEYNSYSSKQILESIFKCGVYDYFTNDEIDCVLRDPIGNHDIAIKLSEFVYTKDGVIANSIDYMKSLLCLDRVVSTKLQDKKSEKNKELMKSTLNTVEDKSFIRDALFTQMCDGIAFYYFETTQKKADNTKYLTDYETESILEINAMGINASIITLPWKYTKVVGKKNNRYVLAFNLRYFDDFTGEKLERKLRKYPKEIVDGYYNKKRQGDWLVLDNNHTMCRKIKCKDTEPWGRSLVISALSDVLYKDYFIDTKRKALDELNNKVVVQTFPSGSKDNVSSLTKNQQENQHNMVKQAVLNKNTKGGTSFCSVAAGTKLDTLDVSTDIFDEKNEKNLESKISMDIGICASLIGAMTTGSYGSNTQNLEMITAQLYNWACEWQKELEYVINKNIIKDERNKVSIYYFPTSFVNRQQFFDMMSSLYTTAGGSLTFLIASTGVDPDIYFNVLDKEIDDGYFEKYLPHSTSWTISDSTDKVNPAGNIGRPKSNNPTDNTIKSQGNLGNSVPSPSDNK